MVKLFTVSVIQLYVHRINDFKELDLGYWAVRTYVHKMLLWGPKLFTVHADGAN